jgi:4-hydroxy-4-methyl-2-oxoglutarate aldolase
MMHMRRKFGRQAMIGDPPVLTLRQNFERPTAAQVAAFEGVPTGFVVDAQMGQGAVDQRIKPL